MCDSLAQAGRRTTNECTVFEKTLPGAQPGLALQPLCVVSQCESEHLGGSTDSGAGETWVPVLTPHLLALGLAKLLKFLTSVCSFVKWK